MKRYYKKKEEQNNIPKNNESIETMKGMSTKQIKTAIYCSKMS